MEDNLILRMIQIGTVTAVDAANRKARVTFQDTGITSDWLAVLQRQGEQVAVAEDGLHSHTCTDGDTNATGKHSHPGTAVTAWIPEVNSVVLVVFPPVRDSKGYIIGRL